MPKRRVIAVVLTFLLVWTGRSWAEESHPITLQRDVAVTMRDGVVLRADIYRPDLAGKFPVLLQRTPYNKDLRADFGVRAAQRGYVVVIEDVRGRHASAGEWYPFKYESQDGYDTVEWAALLPYANGRVGMFGESYVGATQLLTAIAHPPHLAGIAPSDTPSNYHDDWVYQGGAFELGFNQSWTSILAEDTVSRTLLHASSFGKQLTTLPLSDYTPLNASVVPSMSEGASRIAPYYLDWLAHPLFDSYWRRWSIEDHYHDIQVPVLTMTAWYDIFLGGALRNFTSLQTQAGSEAARRNQHLIVTIAGHAGSGRKIGDIDFGPAADEYDEDTITLSWYDYLLKGIQNHWATDKPVRIFVMGINQWRQESQWPIPEVTSRKYFLQSKGSANTVSGDGSLSTEPPSADSSSPAASDHYVYDPADPVPTTGGPLCCDSTYLAGGPRDQRQVEKRNDVLVYSAPPFATDTEMTGPVTVQLYVKSSAPDTDFTAKLIDVWAISNVFLAGHSLRLEISSSNFPRFDRNRNTGDMVYGTRLEKASNTIVHDAAHPSALLLPVMPK